MTIRQITLGIVSACLIFFASCKTESTSHNSQEMSSTPPAYALVIHGGAGTILKKNMTPEKEKEYQDALNHALDIGEKILKEGGSSMDAVVETIKSMEDSPLFNAGKGAVFTNDGENRMDASIMEGSALHAGAIGGVSNVKHPIDGARAVLEKSVHVLLTGVGAEQFCAEQGMEIVEPEYFYTERRWQSLQNILAKEKETGYITEVSEDSKFGTVGAVALDKNGQIVAGTSTGGMTNKKYDRIGDSPIIGAGTYANNKTCGVSCTGHGEYFIRYAVAHDVSAMMEYGNHTLDHAANHIINEKLLAAEGSGGLIALDAQGNISMPFNTAGMYRGYAKPGERYIGIYKNE